MTKIYSCTVVQNSSKIWVRQEQVLNKRTTAVTAHAHFIRWIDIHALLHDKVTAESVLCSFTLKILFYCFIIDFNYISGRKLHRLYLYFYSCFADVTGKQTQSVYKIWHSIITLTNTTS